MPSATAAEPQPTTPSIRVVIVEDHPVTRAGIAAAIAGCDDIVVVGEAATATAARAVVAACEPDVVVCDIGLEGPRDGLDLVAELAPGRSAVLVVSAYDLPALHAAALAAGAAGYLPKSVDARTLLGALRTVAAGGTAFTRAALHSAHTALRRPSAREIELVELVVAGYANEAIAARLAIGSKTVESHLRRLFARYGAMSRTALATLAIREGWIDPASIQIDLG